MKTQPLEPQPIPAGGGERIARKQPAPARAVATSDASEARPMRKVVADLSDMLQNLLESSGATRMAEGGRSPWKPILETGSTRLTSGFGMRKDPFTGSLQHHDGVDIAAPQGTKVFPHKAGRVAFSGWDGGYGKVVKIHHDDGTETRYGHASALLVQPGQRVTQETAIAKVGSTGRSTGPHLHFEIRVNGRPVDPVPYLKGDPVQVASAAYK
jgi:murein DD-endopeptidase MepM/ murein hydrolase activator NlpD